MPFTRTLPALAACLALLAAATASAAGLVQISADPFTNPDSQHATQVEPDNLAFGPVVVSAFQTGRFFDGGSSDIGFATSHDGGLTWTYGFLPSITTNSVPAGPYARVSDPAVAYDMYHQTWMIVSLGIDASGTGAAVLVSRSTDEGLTWSAPVTVATTNGFYDKTWVVCDNQVETSLWFGYCYVTWDDAASGDRLLTSMSNDGGKNWGAPTPTRGNAAGLGGQPLVQPNGHVVVPALSASASRILAYRLIGGKPSKAVTVANVSDHGVAGNLRSEPLPSAGVDSKGKVYVVWQDCRFRSGCSSNDIVMSTSSLGLTWSQVVRIPIDAVSSTVDHFIPGLAVDENSSGATARLALTYYFYPDANCTAATCQLSVGFVSSIDGGASWSAPITLAGPMNVNDLANTSQGFMVGDYISTTFSRSNAVPVVSLASAKSGSNFNQAAFSGMLPVTAEQSYPLKVKNEPVLSTKGDRPARVKPLVRR